MQKNTSQPSAWSLWRSRRRTTRLAAARQQSWDAIRRAQGSDGAGTPGHQSAYPSSPQTVAEPFVHAAAHHDTPGRTLPDTPTTSRRRPRAPRAPRAARPLGLVLYPLAGALGVVMLLPIGSPVVSGRWSPWWFSVGSALVVASGVRYRTTWFSGGRPAMRWGGVVLGLLIVAATAVGLFSQHVVEGRAQVRGSTLDRAIVQLAEAREVVAILADNQGLMNLPAEQAVPLGATFQAAINQDIRIGRLWNPATTGVAPVAELTEVVRLINLAALTQAAALEAQYGNLVNPEPALAAEALGNAARSDALINLTLPAALAAAQQAIVTAAGERP